MNEIYTYERAQTISICFEMHTDLHPPFSDDGRADTTMNPSHPLHILYHQLTQNISKYSTFFGATIPNKANDIMSIQKTKFSNLLDQTTGFVLGTIIGPWKKTSLSLLSLLFGYYLGSNLTTFYLEKIGQRSLVSFSMVLILEVLIRLRSLNNNNKPSYFMVCVDNLRIGAVYAVVLEAFKLGS